MRGASSQAEESFLKLVDKIKEVGGKDEGYMTSMPLYMDEETAIIGFAKDNPQILVARVLVRKYPLKKSFLVGFNMVRPANCPLNKNCLCLCKEVKLKAEEMEKYQINIGDDTSRLGTSKCPKVLCKGVDLDITIEGRVYNAFDRLKIFDGEDIPKAERIQGIMIKKEKDGVSIYYP